VRLLACHVMSSRCLTWVPRAPNRVLHAPIATHTRHTENTQALTLHKRKRKNSPILYSQLARPAPPGGPALEG